MIRVLEIENNRRGDLFARLMGDLFLSLGYEACRFNIHKSGREVDIQAAHRTERRRAVAECKAVADPVGGDDLNKFAGVLQAEEITNRPLDTVGYFVSLAGFRETAIQQEADIGTPRFSMMDSEDVEAVLISSQILASPELAAEQAGRCVGRRRDLRLAPREEWTLLAHQLGWIWAVPFRHGGESVAVALVHADGEVLAPALAQQVIKSDSDSTGGLEALELLTGLDRDEPSEHDVLERYLSHVAAEYGRISLEGLPADETVGSRQLPLETIYVPLGLEPISLAGGSSVDVEPVEDPDADAAESGGVGEQEALGIGEVLSPGRKVAIVATPGAGKSTLLKRLAVAYAIPERRDQPDESLPQEDWLPLVLRCRQLAALIGEPIRTMLTTIPARAEMPDLEASFAKLVDERLRSGRVLLLVDGLDEIPSESDRVTFVGQLRTFLATYPAVTLVVTSRETGFRAVAAGLAPICDRFRVADLSDDAILRLTIAWHREVVGKGEAIEAKASELAFDIIESDRIARLARNPLLLTTLLLVQRWVGEVPRRRSVLYEKAIEVLLMTWNVEAHHPIDIEEAIPQLAFVAFSLLKTGSQLASGRELVELLRQSREEMPEILTFARTSPTDFVARVEERSSLLVQSGHIVEEGVLRPVYEFRHLTFQEYLAAVAAAEGYYPGHRRDESYEAALNPYLEKESWREVLPLAAVRAGRDAKLLVQSLIDQCAKHKRDRPFHSYGPGDALLQCVIDEALLEPDLATEAVLTSIEASGGSHISAGALAKSRYGDLAREAVLERYLAFRRPVAPFGSALARLVGYELTSSDNEFLWPANLSEGLLPLLSGKSEADLVCGALTSMVFAYSHAGRSANRRKLRPTPTEELEVLIAAVHPLLDVRSPPVQHAACWALAWLFSSVPRHQRNERVILTKLLNIWRTAKRVELRRQAAWAVGEMRLMTVTKANLAPPTPELEAFLQRELFGSHSPNDETGRRMRRRAAIITAHYVQGPWAPEILLNMFQAIVDRPRGAPGSARSIVDAEVVRALTRRG